MPKTERESIITAIVGVAAALLGIIVAVPGLAVVGLFVAVAAGLWFAWQVSQRPKTPSGPDVQR